MKILFVTVFFILSRNHILCQNIGSRFSFLNGNKNIVEQNRKDFIYSLAEREINGNGKYHNYDFNPSFQIQDAIKQSQPFKRNSYSRK